MGVAFAFSMRLESQAARQFVSTVQARYIAEAGVSYSRALLDEDRVASTLDDESEAWVQEVAGEDVDVDEDGIREARWRLLVDAEGRTVGRFAVHIADEAGKGNVNIARASPSAFELGAIDLSALLHEAEVANAQAVATQIENYRYGPDQRPGVALVDDDRDGTVDEVDEYQPLAVRGDDRVIDSLEELASIVELDAMELRRLELFVTAYSWDLNIAQNNEPRVNVNTATAEELFAIMLDGGVEDPWQAAVNLTDFADPDLDISRVSKSSQAFAMTNQGPLGSWSWSDSPSGHYESDQPNGVALTWTASVPSGTFRVRALGLSGMPVGHVAVEDVVIPSAGSGELLGTFELSGSLQVSVTHREAVGTTCAFVGLELVSEDAFGGVVVRGIEAVRINELMVEPTSTFQVSEATFNNPQGSGWSCGGDLCTNGGVGQASWIWNSDLRAGPYYLIVRGSAAGQTIGNVCVAGDCELLVHGAHHPSTITVGTDEKFSISIDKTAEGETYYIQQVELSLQPDGEYVELINLSDQMIDVGGWTLEGTATLGRVGKLPGGAVIEPHGYLLAAVDLADGQDGLAGNGIDVRTAWEVPSGVNAVQLEFPGGGLSPEIDWLDTTLPSGPGAHLALRSGSSLVDEVEYPLPVPTSFQSLEKGDPSIVGDSDLDGVDDLWHAALQLYTPGATNDNAGLTETGEDDELIVHDPAAEIDILNRPLEGIGELVGFASGTAWSPFATADLAKVVDRLTVDGLRLETEDHLIEGEGAWAETLDGYEHSGGESGQAGTWQWTAVPEGTYRFSVYGRSGEQMSLRWQLADLTYTEWTPDLSTDAQGRIVVGQVSVGMDEGPPGTLTLEVQCSSVSGICHLDNVRLDPRLIRVGAVNVNTAPLEVLRALPGVTEAVADRIIKGRPFGNQDEKGRGIGDLLTGEVLGVTEEDRLEVFRQVGHLLTTRSNVFRILSLGDALDDDRSTAMQRIQTVVQRY